MSETIFYANTLNTYAISFLGTDVDKTIEITKKGIDYIGDSQTPSVLEKLALLYTNLANAMGVDPSSQIKCIRKSGVVEYQFSKCDGRIRAYVYQAKIICRYLPMILKTNNPLIIGNYNFRIGGLYYQLNDYEKALEHLHQGIL